MDLIEFGEKMRQERERQGFSLKEVAEKTKVSRRSLEAIEEGRRADLPHPVYAKGFVRHYTRFLGIEPELVEDFLAEHFSVEDEPEFHRYEVTETINKVRPASSGSGRSALGPAAVLIALLAVLCGLLGYLYFSDAGTKFKNVVMSRIFQKSDELPVNPAPALAPVPASPAPAEKSAPPARDAVKDQSRAAPAETKEMPAVAAMRPIESKPAEPEPAPAPPRKETPAEPAVAVATPEKEAAPAAPSVPATAPAKATEEKDFGSAGPQLVEILANQPCWLEAGVDGGSSKEFYLNRGQYLTTRFKDKMNVKLGNAGGVTVRYNGKDVSITAPKSGVVSLQFPQ